MVNPGSIAYFDRRMNAWDDLPSHRHFRRNRSRTSSSSIVPIKSVAKLAKSFGLAMSLPENLGDFRYKL